MTASARTIVLISHEVALPRELEHLAARFRLAFPDRVERQAIIERVAGEWARTHGGKVRTDRKSLELLIENLGGLSVGDTERLARKAIFDDGALLPSDLPGVMQAKYELLNRGGVLSFEYDTAQFADLGGMARLKEWLKLRQPAFDGSAPQLEAPKGVLLLGVQGCGKSVAARAAAGIYGVPLLRLDFGAIHNKYIGESERNLRETLATAGVMAPCVLWIDEIEKGVATGDGDSGTSRRLLGAFLTWLAERKTRVFVVATANDITALPPELIRKGRFDEIFFVDLPRHGGPRRDPAHPRRASASCSSADAEVAQLAALLRRVLGRGDRAGGRVRRLRSSRRRPHGRRAGHPAGDQGHAAAVGGDGGEGGRSCGSGRQSGRSRRTNGDIRIPIVR